MQNNTRLSYTSYRGIYCTHAIIIAIIITRQAKNKRNERKGILRSCLDGKCVIVCVHYYNYCKKKQKRYSVHQVLFVFLIAMYMSWVNW
jgi:hypothetical protein